MSHRIVMIAALLMALGGCLRKEEQEAMVANAVKPIYVYDQRTNKCFVDFDQSYVQPMETDCTPEVIRLARPVG